MKLDDFPTSAERAAYLQGALTTYSAVAKAFRETTTREAALEAVDGQLDELIATAERVSQ